MTSDTQLFRSSFSSASSLIALQLFSRVFTFLLNQALFRLASPRAFGTAAIQFELVLSTILFLSREGVRNAFLRALPAKENAQTGGKDPVQTTINLTFIPLLFGFPLALTTSYVYAHFAGTEASSQPHFHFAIAVYALAALTELMSEPMHNMAMAQLRTGVRVRAEGLGIASKTLVTFFILLYDSTRHELRGELALIAFAAGQLAYGVVVCATYLAYYGRMHLWPKRVRSAQSLLAAYFDRDMLRLSLTMTSQSIIKHFLTEGDKLILSWFSPLQDQGGYAIAVNYGSLVARIVFQPIEEMSRVFFSKILSSTTSDPPALRQAADALISLLSIQVSFSAILLVFGTPYMPIVLHVLLPQQYLSTSAPQVLEAWIWYIPVLAINGGLEAFLSSAATPSDLNQQSRWMAGFSFIYISTAVALYGLHLGDASLVYANIVNLTIRIAYSLHFISRFFSEHGARDNLQWASVMPNRMLILALSFSATLIGLHGKTQRILEFEENGRSALLTRPVAMHVLLGGVLALVCLGIWWKSAGRYLVSPERGVTKSSRKLE